MKGYKAFAKGMVCKGKQYSENTIFEEEVAEIGKNGMHFCKHPMDVLDYYPLIDDNGNLAEFAEVEALDEVKTDNDKKYCTKKLKVKGKISFAELVQASIRFEPEKTEAENNSEDFFASFYGSDYSDNIISYTGECAKIGNNRDESLIDSSGNFAQIGNSGNYAQIASTGYSAQIGSSGDYARVSSIGNHSVVMCAGNKSIARAKKGSWITLSEWQFDDNIKANIPICVKTIQVDGEIIKEDTFYKLENGEFVEVVE